MTEASVTTGCVTATRMKTGHIRIVVKNGDGSINSEMIVTAGDAQNICSSLSMLSLILGNGGQHN